MSNTLLVPSPFRALVLYGPRWHPAEEAQAIDRTRRIGQPRAPDACRDRWIGAILSATSSR